MGRSLAPDIGRPDVRHRVKERPPAADDQVDPSRPQGGAPVDARCAARLPPPGLGPRGHRRLRRRGEPRGRFRPCRARGPGHGRRPARRPGGTAAPDGLARPPARRAGLARRPRRDAATARGRRLARPGLDDPARRRAARDGHHARDGAAHRVVPGPRARPAYVRGDRPRRARPQAGAPAAGARRDGAGAAVAGPTGPVPGQARPRDRRGRAGARRRDGRDPPGRPRQLRRADHRVRSRARPGDAPCGARSAVRASAAPRTGPTAWSASTTTPRTRPP